MICGGGGGEDKLLNRFEGGGGGGGVVVVVSGGVVFIRRPKTLMTWPGVKVCVEKPLSRPASNTSIAFPVKLSSRNTSSSALRKLTLSTFNLPATAPRDDDDDDGGGGGGGDDAAMFLTNAVLLFWLPCS